MVKRKYVKLYVKQICFMIFVLLIIYRYSFGQTENNKPEFVFVKGGNYVIGSTDGDIDELPQKRIYISDFYFGKYEITNGQYAAFLNDAGLVPDSLHKYIDLNGKWEHIQCRIYIKDGSYAVEPGFENYPVNYVSWYGADAYCKQYGFRLPTEAEWEYAAKGGKKWFLKAVRKKNTAYAGHKVPDSVAWYRKNSEEKVHGVGQKMPNQLGIYDMSGNVDEWCNDWYLEDSYVNMPDVDPPGPESADFKVYRGGSWYNSEKMLRITNRRAANPKSQKATLGFRVVKDIKTD